MVDVNGQIEVLVRQYDELRKDCSYDDLSDAKDEAAGRVLRLCTRVIAAGERLLPSDSVYAQQAEDAVRRHPRSGQINNPGGVILSMFEILRAYAEDVDAGFLQQVEAEIQAGVFADFLDMAAHVLTDVHKTPAAIIAGFTLEEHLRKICEARDLSTEKAPGQPKTAESLNQDLAQAGAYSGKTEGEVAAWIGRRNDAAHGRHDEFTDAQVNLMIEGVRAFIVRHPA